MSRGDFFLCSSEEQRTFYLGFLTALGRVNPERIAEDPDLATLIAPGALRRAGRAAAPPAAAAPPRGRRAAPPLRRPLRLVRPVDPARRPGAPRAAGLDPAADPQPQPGEHAPAPVRRGRGALPLAGLVGEPRPGPRLGAGRAALRPAARRRPPRGAPPAEPGDAPLAAHPLPRRSGRRLSGGHQRGGRDEPPAGRAPRRLGGAGRRRPRPRRGPRPRRSAIRARAGKAPASSPRAFRWERVLAPLVRFCREPWTDATKERFGRRPATVAPPDRLAFRLRRKLRALAGETGERLKPLRKVSVAILSWNGRQHLETCLAALAAQQDPGVDWEILVLDNGSTDGTAAWMRERWGGDRRVRLIESPVNLGFCAGNNRLVAEADGDAVALLNNDTRPEPGWLGSLVETLASAPADVAAVSGKIVDWNGERLDFGRGVMTFDGHAFQLDFRRPLAEGAGAGGGGGARLRLRRQPADPPRLVPARPAASTRATSPIWRTWTSAGASGPAASGSSSRRAPSSTIAPSATSDLLGLYNRGFLFERNAFLTAYKNYEDGLWERIMPAVMLTLLSRTQALLEANPGDGHPADRPLRRPHRQHRRRRPAAAPPPPPGPELPPAHHLGGPQGALAGLRPAGVPPARLRKLGVAPPPVPPSQPQASRRRASPTSAPSPSSAPSTGSWAISTPPPPRRAAVQKRRRAPRPRDLRALPGSISSPPTPATSASSPAPDSGPGCRRICR